MRMPYSVNCQSGEGEVQFSAPFSKGQLSKNLLRDKKRSIYKCIELYTPAYQSLS